MVHNDVCFCLLSLWALYSRILCFYLSFYPIFLSFLLSFLCLFHIFALSVLTFNFLYSFFQFFFFEIFHYPNFDLFTLCVHITCSFKILSLYFCVLNLPFLFLSSKKEFFFVITLYTISDVG